MNSNFTGSLIVVFTGIIGVATLAVILSKNANTAQVITSTGTAFSGALNAATAPITGASSFSSFAPSVQF